MNDIDLTQRFKNKMAPYKRTIGRYNSSELYFINEGLLSPEDWLNPPEKSLKEMFTMWDGIGSHTQLEDLLGTKNSEIKKVTVYRGISLVAKVDFLPPGLDEVWEFKSSKRKMSEMKEWHAHQVKLYCSIFEKEKGIVYQPVRNDDGIYLKNLGSVDRDDQWFREEFEKLFKFHLKVISLTNLTNGKL